MLLRLLAGGDQLGIFAGMLERVEVLEEPASQSQEGEQ